MEVSENKQKEVMDALREIYYNPVTGFQSSSKLYQRLKNSKNPIPYSVVKSFVKGQLSNQILSQPPKPSVYNTINATAPGSNYQLDIMVYDRYTYHSYKYILVVIDVYSRFATCVALTNRKMDTIINAVKKCFKTLAKMPENLNCDGEFNKKEFNSFMDKEGIKVWYSEPYEINKNAIVERFNRTLALLLQRWRIGSGSYDWPKVLQELVDNYNQTYHSTIKATPLEVWEGKKINMQKKVFIRPMFQPGNMVRIKRIKSVFDKGDVLSYSKEVYMVREVKGNRVYLKDVEKWYKPYELILVNAIEYQPHANKEELKVHQEEKAIKEIIKMKKEEGIDQKNVQREKRQPKLKPELIEYLKGK